MVEDHYIEFVIEARILNEARDQRREIQVPFPGKISTQRGIAIAIETYHRCPKTNYCPSFSIEICPFNIPLFLNTRSPCKCRSSISVRLHLRTIVSSRSSRQ
jgi:hypothetical protein